jgi:pimeloyl-ACP methyl ester carboxylesterase
MISSSGYQRVNGLRLWVHRFREASAPPSGLTIVLVHGFMDAGASWDLVAPALARGGNDVVAPDLRGFGQSDFVGPGGYYHFPDYVADLAELVDALAPRRLAIVGHSMGGTIAALYTGTYPERVERLALLEGMGPLATEPRVSVDRMSAWMRTMREVSRAPKPLSSLQEAIERLSLHHPRIPRDVIESRARLLTRADDTGRLVWAYDPLHRTTAPTPFNVESFKEFLRRIECPTLVVSGGSTGWHPPDEDERVACLAHAQRTEIAHAGHMMHWTEPSVLGQRLAAFLGEAPVVKTRVSPQMPDAGSVGTELPLSVPSIRHAAGPIYAGAAAVTSPLPPTLDSPGATSGKPPATTTPSPASPASPDIASVPTRPNAGSGS